MKSTSQTQLLLGSGICWVILLIGLNFSPQVFKARFNHLDLTGTWQHCNSSVGSAQSTCQWTDAKMPGSIVGMNEEVESFLLRKYFRAPSFCFVQGAGCQLFLGTVDLPQFGGHLA